MTGHLALAHLTTSQLAANQPLAVAYSGAQIALFLVVLARVSGLVLSAPVLGDQAVPRSVKAILAVVLAFVVAQVPTLSAARVPQSMAPFAFDVVAQLLVGISLGLVARLLFFAVQTAGEIVSMQIGLSAASIFNPLTREPNPIMGQLYSIVAVITFLALNGDLWVVAALSRSFDLVTIGGGFSAHMVTHIIDEAATVTQLGFQIAMPIAASIFAATVVLGVVSRSLPQLNVFVLSMPLNMMLGLLAIVGSMGATVVLLGHLVTGLPREMLSLNLGTP